MIVLGACRCHATGGSQGMENISSQGKYTNRLAKETSPYLLQHAHNPVDWYPWGGEAFARARKENRPIFLSIGYSTCHWCHVMERESFSDERIAKIMNEHFVCVKVDREQRPDVDAVYMNAVRMMTGSGGWPLSVFLTPEGKPFYGGTYFPPQDLYGRPSFERVLSAIADEWKNNREDVMESAGKITGRLEGLGRPGDRQKIDADSLKNAYTYFRSAFDRTYGGFGGAPKFPQPSNLSMLLGYWHRTRDANALDMVEVTLDAMAKGGIYDHIGGGFHRYSTDRGWLVPHFEKMVYDQALLSKSYMQAYQATRKESYARVVREVFEYVLRDMTDSGGGFYSAEDADSEGREGLFYVWEPNETAAVLGAEQARIFNDFYGVTAGGNFEGGKSILHVTMSEEESAKRFKMDKGKLQVTLAEARGKLLKHRSKRVRPHRDDKIIAAWNGMMISSLAYGGAVLGEDRYVNAASGAADFVLSRLRNQGRLMHYYRDGRAVEKGFLDDYAFMITGLLDLYQATFDARRLGEAKALAEQMTALFGDEKGGGFFFTGNDGERLIVRDRSAYDGAVPSGNSAAALVLLRLGKMTMDERFIEGGRGVIETFSSKLSQSPESFSGMLAAADFYLGPTQEIVIAGRAGQPDTKEMLRLARSVFLPNSLVLFHESGAGGAAVEKLVPFLKWQNATGGKATAYVCENYACKRPVTDAAEVKAMLEDIAGAPARKGRGDNKIEKP